MTKIANGIKVIDSGYYSKDFASIYILRQVNKVAIIETGNNFSVSNIQKALEKDGLSFSDVAYVIPTHVHLDHAGGAGQLMKQCKDAKLIVHPRGARHMIDPQKLIAGATAVYGEKKFKELYGDIIPIEANRVIEAEDNFILDFGGRELKFIDTPGHAKHHYTFYDTSSKTIFMGVTLGLIYPHGDFVQPNLPPPDFNKDQLFKSLEDISKLELNAVAIAHFGIHEKPYELMENSIKNIEMWIDFTKEINELSNQEAANKLSVWVKNNYMSLNIDKDTIDNYMKNSIFEMQIVGIRNSLN